MSIFPSPKDLYEKAQEYNPFENLYEQLDSYFKDHAPVIKEYGIEILLTDELSSIFYSTIIGILY